MAGKPVIKGTRIPVKIVLKRLAENLNPKRLFEDYPRLTEDDIKATPTYESNKKNNNCLPRHNRSPHRLKKCSLWQEHGENAIGKRSNRTTVFAMRVSQVLLWNYEMVFIGHFSVCWFSA
jgi:uncharacterized protein (DUF433 family)